MRTIFFATSMLVLLTGCSSPSTHIEDASNFAKIRVFHGTAVYMYPGKTCYGPKNDEMIHAAAGGFSILVANKKVGMPVTDDIPWSYHEYLIPTGKPLTLEMSWAVDGGGTRQSCGPIGATFTPEAGKFYDTSMHFAKGYCSIQLRELIEISAGKAAPVSTAKKSAVACP